MKKKLASVLLCAVMAASMLTGCGNADNATATTPATDNKTDAATTTEAAEKTAEKTAEAAGSVYYLNFKPEVDEVWQKLAKEYTEETGVPVKVVTAASGTYEQTLMSEIANKEAPTLFQINGPIGYQNWKDYCADLKDTDLYTTSSRTRVSPIPITWSSLTPITSRTFSICTSTTPAQHPVCWEASL